MVLVGGRSIKKKERRVSQKMTTYTSRLLFRFWAVQTERKVKKGQTSFSHQEVPNQNNEKQIPSLESNTEIVSVK